MKVTVFKNYLNGERVAVSSVEDLAEAVRRGDYADAVSDYRCASPDMLVARSNGETVNRAVRMATTAFRACVSPLSSGGRTANAAWCAATP